MKVKQLREESQLTYREREKKMFGEMGGNMVFGSLNLNCAEKQFL